MTARRTTLNRISSWISRSRIRKLANKASEAQARQDWQTAERLWVEAINAAPRNAGAWIQRGNVLNELGRRDEAIASFEQARTLAPNLVHAPAGIAGVHERAARWDLAEPFWHQAVTTLSSQGDDNPKAKRELVHALLHRALSAGRNGRAEKAVNDINHAIRLAPDLLRNSHNARIVADVMSVPGTSEPKAFNTLAVTMLAPSLLPDVAAVADDRRKTLLAIFPELLQKQSDAGLLIVADVLFERAGMWREVLLLAEQQAQIAVDPSSFIERAFQAAVHGRLLTDARRLALRYAALRGDLILVHELAKLYESAGQYVRSRLLTRFIRRRWPHSRWHVLQYILLTAMTRSLEHADRLIQIEIRGGRRDRDLEYAFCRAAFEAGSFDEARRRLLEFTKRYDDQSAEVLLGYAIANSLGILEADQFFQEAAARQIQSAGTLVGMAHMAMRRRDFPAALERWQHIAAIHPELTHAHVEIARSAYEMRDIDGAERICTAYLRRDPHDPGIGELYAWLLTISGRYTEARAALEVSQQRSGPSWDAARLFILGAAELGDLDYHWNDIAAMMPMSDDDRASSQFYHVIRALIAVERTGFVDTMLDQSPWLPARAWMWPYLVSAGITDEKPVDKQAKSLWIRSQSRTSVSISERLDLMSDADIDTLLSRTTGFPTIHIVNKFEQPRGGSELHALDLAVQLRRYTDVALWAPEMPHPDLTIQGVRGIDPSTADIPLGGVLVFVGVYFDIERWIGLTKPHRAIFLYNTFEAPAFFARIEEVFIKTEIKPEILYCSTMMSNETGVAGRFEPSPTDLDLFHPALVGKRHEQPFRLGRHSRDVVEKHGSQDWKVYQAVSDLGGESIVLGGTCMRGAYPKIPNLHLMPARSTGIPDFLRSLDAYLYRTSTWIEPWGRVVIEAMACGLPVVAHAVGGYAQAIRHEVNGFLFDTTEEAVRLVRRLADEPLLRERLGYEARLSTQKLLSDAEMKRLIAFYLLD